MKKRNRPTKRQKKLQKSWCDECWRDDDSSGPREILFRELDPDGPEAKAEYAAKAPVIMRVLQAMNLETLADNFRHANVFDENLHRMSNAECRLWDFER